MDTETLRPNASGDLTECSIGGDTPAPTNWQSVDEVVADDDTTYVYQPGITSKTDLYNLPASSGEGTINFIKLYLRIKCVDYGGKVYPKIKTGGTIYTGAAKTATAEWVTHNHQWTDNPQTEVAWTWDDIDALQIGFLLGGAAAGGQRMCTQVYIEVDYTPPPPVVGRSFGYIIG